MQLVLEALGLRATLPVLLWALPLDRTLQALTAAAAATRSPSPAALTTIEQITDLVTRHFALTRTACLKRALMRYVLLRQQGLQARFVIGVRPGGDDGFEAHAWVTVDEVVVMEREPLDYRRTFVWPAESSCESSHDASARQVASTRHTASRASGNRPVA